MTQSIGPHRLAIAQGVVCWEPHGEILPEHAEALLIRCVEYLQQNGILLVLIDSRDLKPLSAEVRSLYVKSIRQHAPRMAFGIFGASLAIRAVQTLTYRAASLLSGLELRFRHFSSQSSALEYLLLQRDELRGLTRR